MVRQKTIKTPRNVRMVECLNARISVSRDDMGGLGQGVIDWMFATGVGTGQYWQNLGMRGNHNADLWVRPTSLA